MVIVVKAGGRALNKNMDGIVKNLAEVSRREKVVFVHGGGDIVTEISKKLGIEPKFVMSPEGIRSRYTDEKELEVYVMVMAGKINKTIVSKLLALNVPAVGITGADGQTLLAERKKRIVIVDERGRKRVIDGGYTGKVIKAETGLIQLLLDKGFTIVVAPIAVDSEGTLLNVDGDQAAYAIATALKASNLIILTDVEGVIIDNVVVPEIKSSSIERIIEKIGPGMNRKVMLAGKAVEEGVDRVVIASGVIDNPVTNALNGKGTVVVKG
ncbi:[LysW]-aminoadipate/[LysW]-glutamate kinase [Ignisphaera sp. 4213-co]|uniref:Putative [LysW]-aminoadipate/[LysW]-glutamate kinase n=1 Tax=Ignisphaera cupida TaxID=3050454 RepID=A0ABD4Z7M4_9CREN|nr:[LysW]-aminoadipate/[LysW]-glutamate kinase [Ignisphaera sp. 4213-co]MDK6029139.1 [LysW]-aminoadipate/[LysW]-glutamate kinase [Ignisphaera sp. 4213-co]